MKTKLIYVIALVFFVQIANAQTFGIKGGINFANLNFSSGGVSYTPKSITGIHLGVVADFQLKESLYLNTGLQYSLKGAKFNSGENSGSSKINYLEIPLNLAYKFPISETSKFFIQAGPYFGYALGGKDEENGVSTDIKFEKDEYKRLDCGLGFGAGLEFGSVVTSLNYQLGLANIYDNEDEKVKNKVFQISVAYMFGKKK